MVLFSFENNCSLRLPKIKQYMMHVVSRVITLVIVLFWQWLFIFRSLWKTLQRNMSLILSFNPFTYIFLVIMFFVKIWQRSCMIFKWINLCPINMSSTRWMGTLTAFVKNPLRSDNVEKLEFLLSPWFPHHHLFYSLLHYPHLQAPQPLQFQQAIDKNRN